VRGRDAERPSGSFDAIALQLSTFGRTIMAKKAKKAKKATDRFFGVM